MPNPLGRNSFWRFVWVIGLIWLGAVVCLAQRLPVRQYTIADGLAQGTVWAMHQDARGFLWLATSDGLSRFDGYRFTNYGVSDGLGHSHVHDITSDRRGRVWIATGVGVSLVLDEAEVKKYGKKFLTFRLASGERADDINWVQRLHFDADNRLWCATVTGLYRSKSVEVATEQFERIGLPEFERSNPLEANNVVSRLFSDRRGCLWASFDHWLLRVESGNVTLYKLWEEAGEATGDPDHRWIRGSAELPDGRILIATEKDLYEFIEPPLANQRGGWRRLPLTLAPNQIIWHIHPAAKGGFWIGTEIGLIHYRGGQQTNYRIGNSPNPFVIHQMLTDRDSNLWIGTRQTGLLKLAGEAIAVYDTSDGLRPVKEVYFLNETKDGRMILGGRPNSRFHCNETFLIDETESGPNRIVHLQPPPNLCNHHLVQDRRKNWWMLRWLPERKVNRVFFIPGPTLNFSAGYELTAADGWEDGGYATMYEDSEGDLWFRKQGNIYRTEYTGSGRPRLREVVKTTSTYIMARDPSGTIWFSNGGQVFRYRNGNTETVRVHDKNAQQSVHRFFFDRRGRLWIPTQEYGLFVAETPNDQTPRFRNYTFGQERASNVIEAVSEDDEGRIWLGTWRGMVILDEATSNLTQVSFHDNTIGSVVRDLWKDSRGNIWASVLNAVIRINPRLLPRPSVPLPVYFNHINVAGESLPLAETGIGNLALPDLSAERNNLAIEFHSPHFRGENTLRYQYKLEGAGGDWSEPSLLREVNFANLAPGSYTFLVRAMDDTGQLSAEAASLRFTILRPVWQRWWFVLMSVIGLAGIGYGLHRYRLAQLMRVEQVRTRIARDLHDDVGAGLSQISLLSEIIQRRTAHDAAIAEPLSAIAGTSRELVDTMSDIVWTNNPRFDHLGDLVHRCRRFATESLAPRGIRLRTDFPDNDGDLTLEPETRRQLYLIFKEAITNVARHADCDEAEISLRVENGWLQMRIADNGNGFDAEHQFDGNGLRSLRARAEAIGGTLEIESAPNAGTTLTLRLQV